MAYVRAFGSASNVLKREVADSACRRSIVQQWKPKPIDAVENDSRAWDAAAAAARAPELGLERNPTGKQKRSLDFIFLESDWKTQVNWRLKFQGCI